MRISSIVAGVTLAFGLAACSDSSPDLSPPASPLTGTYSVKTVDGQPLPWTNPDHPDFTLVSETATVDADGTWSDTGTYSNGTTATQSGTVTVSGSTATISYTSGTVLTATVSGGTITVNGGGHVFVLQ